MKRGLTNDTAEKRNAKKQKTSESDDVGADEPNEFVFFWDRPTVSAKYDATAGTLTVTSSMEYYHCENDLGTFARDFLRSILSPRARDDLLEYGWFKNIAGVPAECDLFSNGVAHQGADAVISIASGQGGIFNFIFSLIDKFLVDDYNSTLNDQTFLAPFLQYNATRQYESEAKLLSTEGSYDPSTMNFVFEDTRVFALKMLIMSSGLTLDGHWDKEELITYDHIMCTSTAREAVYGTYDSEADKHFRHNPWSEVFYVLRFFFSTLINAECDSAQSFIRRMEKCILGSYFAQLLAISVTRDDERLLLILSVMHGKYRGVAIVDAGHRLAHERRMFWFTNELRLRHLFGQRMCPMIRGRDGNILLPESQKSSSKYIDSFGMKSVSISELYNYAKDHLNWPCSLSWTHRLELSKDSERDKPYRNDFIVPLSGCCGLTLMNIFIVDILESKFYKRVLDLECTSTSQGIPDISRERTCRYFIQNTRFLIEDISNIYRNNTRGELVFTPLPVLEEIVTREKFIMTMWSLLKFSTVVMDIRLSTFFVAQYWLGCRRFRSFSDKMPEDVLIVLCDQYLQGTLDFSDYDKWTGSFDVAYSLPSIPLLGLASFALNLVHGGNDTIRKWDGNDDNGIRIDLHREIKVEDNIVHFGKNILFKSEYECLCRAWPRLSKSRILSLLNIAWFLQISVVHFDKCFVHEASCYSSQVLQLMSLHEKTRDCKLLGDMPHGLPRYVGNSFGGRMLWHPDIHFIFPCVVRRPIELLISFNVLGDSLHSPPRLSPESTMHMMALRVFSKLPTEVIMLIVRMVFLLSWFSADMEHY